MKARYKVWVGGQKICFINTMTNTADQIPKARIYTHQEHFKLHLSPWIILICIYKIIGDINVVNFVYTIEHYLKQLRHSFNENVRILYGHDHA